MNDLRVVLVSIFIVVCGTFIGIRLSSSAQCVSFKTPVKKIIYTSVSQPVVGDTVSTYFEKVDTIGACIVKRSINGYIGRTLDGSIDIISKKNHKVSIHKTYQVFSSTPLEEIKKNYSIYSIKNGGCYVFFKKMIRQYRYWDENWEIFYDTYFINDKESRYIGSLSDPLKITEINDKMICMFVYSNYDDYKNVGYYIYDQNGRIVKDKRSDIQTNIYSCEKEFYRYFSCDIKKGCIIARESDTDKLIILSKQTGQHVNSNLYIDIKENGNGFIGLKETDKMSTLYWDGFEIDRYGKETGKKYIVCQATGSIKKLN